MGGALTAVSPDIHRAVLGVPGMNYSTLLRRSVDFDLYAKGELAGVACDELPGPGDAGPLAPVIEPLGPAYDAFIDVCRQLPTPVGLYDNYPNQARAAADPVADPDALGPRRGERLRAPHDDGPARRTRRRTRSSSTPPSATTRSRRSPPRSRRGRSARSRTPTRSTPAGSPASTRCGASRTSTSPTRTPARRSSTGTPARPPRPRRTCRPARARTRTATRATT